MYAPEWIFEIVGVVNIERDVDGGVTEETEQLAVVGLEDGLNGFLFWSRLDYGRGLYGRGHRSVRIVGNRKELHASNDSLQLSYLSFQFADARLHLLRTFDGPWSLDRRGSLSTRERAARASGDDDGAFC